MPSPRTDRHLAGWRGALALALLVGAACPVAAQTVDAPEPTRVHGDRVSIFGGDLRVPANVIQDGTVVVVGADAVVDGQVRGDVVVILGSLRLGGKVRGSVVSILSDTTLKSATVGEQLVVVAGRLERIDTEVGGQVVNIGLGGWLPGLPGSFGALSLFIFWWRLAKTIGIFVVVVLLVALVPERIRALGAEAPRSYFVALLVGILAYLVGLVLLVLLAVTLIGFPVALVLFKTLKWLGTLGLFHALGLRVGRSLGREMSLLGSVLLVFAAYAALTLVPLFFGLAGLIVSVVLSSLLWFFVSAPAVGLVLLTRAGSPKASRSA